MPRTLRKHAFLLTVIIAVVVATASYAYVNSVNSVNPPNLGSGSGAIGKYSVPGGASGITYNLNANDTRNIDSVSFTLTGSSIATVARINLPTGWYACSSAAAPTITCATTAPQATAASANGTTITIVARN